MATRTTTRRGAHDYRAVNPPPAYTWVNWLTFALGLALLGAGLAGFFVDAEGFASDEGGSLFGFEVNPLHDIVHVLSGLAALATWRRVTTAGAFGAAFAVIYGAVTVYGLFAADEEWDPLAINAADNGLHLAFTLAGIAIAVGAARLRRSGVAHV